jgi:hypothetical protein
LRRQATADGLRLQAEAATQGKFRVLKAANERISAMRALSLSFVAFLSVAAPMVATPKPALAQAGYLPMAKAQVASEVEEIGYRYRHWRYRPYYRPYYGGYYRPYYRPYAYRPYYSYPYYYRPYYRPWWGPGISFGFWF